MIQKVVLITGASHGIGRATAIEFAKHGYDVIINYANSDDAAVELKKELQEKYNINAMTYRADISDEIQVKSMMAEIGKKYKKIDALVNNAGIVYDRPFSDITIEQFNQTLKIDVMGAFIVSRASESYLRGGAVWSMFRPLMERKQYPQIAWTITSQKSDYKVLHVI